MIDTKFRDILRWQLCFLGYMLNSIETEHIQDILHKTALKIQNKNYGLTREAT
jgi:hypothetical protein